MTTHPSTARRTRRAIMALVFVGAFGWATINVLWGVPNVSRPLFTLWPLGVALLAIGLWLGRARHDRLMNAITAVGAAWITFLATYLVLYASLMLLVPRGP